MLNKLFVFASLSLAGIFGLTAQEESSQELKETGFVAQIEEEKEEGSVLSKEESSETSAILACGRCRKK